MALGDDAKLDALIPYSIGFLKAVKQNEETAAYEPAGSGVLVEIAGIRGILTAAHVIRNLQTGIPRAVIFTAQPNKLRAPILIFNPADLDPILFGGINPSKTGPDLAFIRVPIEVVSSLKSNNLFYSFDARVNNFFNSGTTTIPRFQVIAGVVKANSKFKSSNDQYRTDSHALTLAYGETTAIEKMDDEFDVFQFKVHHNENVPRPHSYAGMSGSAIWGITDSHKPFDRHIFGIAFYETPNESGEGNIIFSHGPVSIYGKLASAVSAKYSS